MNTNTEINNNISDLSGVKIFIIPIYPESDSPEFNPKLHRPIPTLSEHHSVDDAIRTLESMPDSGKYQFGLVDSTGEDIAFVSKEELAGMFDSMATEALKTRAQDEPFNMHTMDHERYRMLEQTIRNESDDIKCLIAITENLVAAYPKLSQSEIKLASEEVLYNIRNKVSNELANVLYQNPVQLHEYIADVDIDIMDLSKLKFTAPDEYHQSNLVQELQRNLETLKQLDYLISNDRYEDKELGIINPDSLHDDFYTLVSETRKAGTCILNDSHRDAYASEHMELVNEASLKRDETFLNLTKSVLNSGTENDALIEIDIYNEMYFGGQLDNTKIYEAIQNSNHQNNTVLSDVSQDSDIFKMVSPIVEAKILLGSKLELIKMISETEANLSSFSISKELGFESTVTEALHEKLEFALPVFQAIKSILNEQPEKHTIPGLLNKDIDKLTSEIINSLGESKNPKSANDGNVPLQPHSSTCVSVTRKMS